MADTDGDGIKDGDETVGTTAGLNLYGMGARPLKKDLLFEYDWFDDSNDCGAHTHRPAAAALTRLDAAFAAAPITNPDGTTGITSSTTTAKGAFSPAATSSPTRTATSTEA